MVMQEQLHVVPIQKKNARNCFFLAFIRHTEEILARSVSAYFDWGVKKLPLVMTNVNTNYTL